MKLKFNLKLKAIFVISAVLVAFLVGYGAAQSGYTTPDIYIDALPTGYVIETDGNGYWVTLNGKVVSSGTDCSVVVNAVTSGEYGVSVKFGLGHFWLSAPIYVKSEQKIYGSGFGTVIERSTDTVMFTFREHYGQGVSQSYNRLSDMVLDGHGAGFVNPMIFLYNVKNSMFCDLMLRNFSRDGLQTQAFEPNGAVVCTFYNSYRDITIAPMVTNDGAGLHFGARDSDNSVDNVVGSATGTGMIGIWLDGAGGFRCSNCHIDGTKVMFELDGSVYNCAYNILDGNSIDLTEEHGIVLKAVDANVFENEIIHNNFGVIGTSENNTFSCVYMQSADNYKYIQRTTIKDNYAGLFYYSGKTHAYVVYQLNVGSGSIDYTNIAGNTIPIGWSGDYHLEVPYSGVSGVIEGNVGHNIASLIVPSVANWNVNPSDLANSTDGSFSVPTTVGNVVYGGAYGANAYMKWDLRAICNYHISAKIVIGNNDAVGSAVRVYVYGSADDASYYVCLATQSVWVQNSQAIVFIDGSFYGRFAQVVWGNDATPCTVYGGVYEITATLLA